ncbi:MAG: AAA family ATPase [Treponema sp.]|nr:AAA family ATPase [Treponema sp.]
MEMYVERGESRMDCELKIARKYNRHFQILREKEIRLGGILGGLFSKPGIEVEFYFSPKSQSASIYASSLQAGNYQSQTAEPRRFYENARQTDVSQLDDAKKKLLAAAEGRLQSINSATDAPRAGKDSSQQFLDAINELKDMVQKNNIANNNGKDEHPAFIRVKELLRQNDFSEKYIEKMLDRLKKEMSLDQLNDLKTVQDHLLNWIGESISVFKEDAAFYSGFTEVRKPRVMVLIGPTGVGKTTTISKLAAIYGIGNDETPAIEVKMITIDAFRICAKDQLEHIGAIMQIPVSCVDSRQDLRKEIALCSDETDLVLIDTIGKSPKDASKLGEMKEILDGAGRAAEYHLVISAGTKTSDIEEILRQFEPFNYKAVILTKIDETDRIGNIISALAEKNKSVSYITDGQEVPVDIKRASVTRFLINLEGFKIDRDKIEERFPSGEAEQFKWR